MQWKKKTVPNLFPYSLTHKPPEIITAIQNYKWESAIMNPWHKNKNKKRLSDNSHTWCPHHRPDSSHFGHLQTFVQWALHYPCGIGACTDLLFLVPLHSPWSLVNLCLFLLASLCYPLTLLLFHILLFLFFSSTCCIASSLKPLEHNHTGVKVASGDLDLSSPGHVCEHSAGMWAQIYKHQDWISAVPNVEQQTSCLRFGFALMPVMLPCSAPRPYVIVQFTAICNIFRYPLLGI